MRKPTAAVVIAMALVLSGCGGSAVTVEQVALTETDSALQADASAATPAPQAVDILGVIDGDTIETTAGKVRLIGIDTPEQGAWGYSEAGAELGAFLSTGPVTLVAVAGRDDADRYGRLLRYVRVRDQDAGLHMLQIGWAGARYDSRDGYGSHPLEAEYIALDEARAMPAQPAPPPAQPVPAQPAPAQPAPAPDQPANDPRFGTCKEAVANGYGDYRSGVDPEYAWYRDADSDGIVCEK